MLYPDYQGVEKANVREAFEKFWGQSSIPSAA
jgi:hypothetical protein